MEHKETFYRRVLNVWEELCSLHNKLYEFTCEEYLCLLESNLERLESFVEQKKDVLELIEQQEKNRAELMQEINATYGTEIERVYQLIELIEPDNSVIKSPLRKLNLLLIDIIEKIQEQNKKNQDFLQKALHSLDEIQLSFSGGKKMLTYGPRGQQGLSQARRGK